MQWGKDFRIPKIVVAAILFIIIIRCYLQHGELGEISRIFLGMLETITCMGIFAGWGFSIRQRITQLQVRRCLLCISYLLVFWMMVRGVKFYYVTDINKERFLWYLYYVPMIFIPFLTFLVAMSIDRSQMYRFSRWMILLMSYAFLLVLFVLTNDLHQCVFYFSEIKGAWTNSDYQYGWGYYVVAGWMFCCAVAAFIMMSRKYRLPRSYNVMWVPIISIIVSVCYTISYIILGKGIFCDLTLFFCFIFIITLENCIQCGLIHANTDYEILFKNSSFGAQIMDENYQVKYSSINAYPLDKEECIKVASETLKIQSDTLIKSYPIKNGYVVWKEDITELNKVLQQLEENKENIAESVTVEWENYITQVKIHTLKEKNRLYDKLQEQTAYQIEHIDQLFKQYEQEVDTEKRYHLMAKIIVIGAYIKRRGNLLFIAEKTKQIDTQELLLCINESFVNLELLDVACGVAIEEGKIIDIEEALKIYELIEKIIELMLEEMKSIWVKLRFEKKRMILHIEAEGVLTDEALKLLDQKQLQFYKEEGIWHFTLYLGQGGKV